MTRAPRTRKKKAAPVADATAAAVADVATSSPESMHLDLSLPESELARDAAQCAALPAAATVAATTIDRVVTEGDAPAVEAEAETVRPAAIDERSTLRVEVVDDRSHIGQRLRAAREVRGWSREDVAHRLHVPTTVVADIETERFDRLGAPIYVRGYLTKYAQLLGLPMVVVHRAIEGMIEPTLKASTESPRVVATWERYRVAVIGGVITLALAIPVLTLVANRGINAPVPQVRSLDESELGDTVAVAPRTETLSVAVTPPIAANDVVPGSGSGLAEAAMSAIPQVDIAVPPVTPESAPENPPLLASMAGFATPAADGMHVLEARFREDSWIEIFDADGRVIEQNLVRAGQSRRYESTGAVSIKIGNVGGVDVQADGNPIDLATHARANVARLRLFEEAATTPTP
ncbi:MAG TPA: RodZ domain-containing protein [Patescibacteria group bacterium]|nr:RodZ domain-containing protein [Patescibacteria group bacterium]